MTATVRPTDGLPSGDQFLITHGDNQATITQVGATLRSYRVDGHDVLDGFTEGERATDGRGQVLVPWPNRIADGHYRYGDHECQVPLNEPSRHDAIHGLVRWLDWTLTAREEASLSMGCVIRPQPGYEWQLDVTVSYLVDDAGLTVRLRAVNTGPERAPFGAGFHPYLTPGRGSIDRFELTVPATHYLDLSDPNQPPPLLPVAGEYDLIKPHRLGQTQLDTAFARLIRGEDGIAVATVRDPETGRAVQLWADTGYPYLMIYTADQVSQAERRRTAVAIEPMTCPPNAFRSGTGLIELDPGASWTGRWGLRCGSSRG